MTMKEFHPATGAINKESLYGTYLHSAKRRQNLADKAIHKALDLPLDEDVNVTNVKTSGVNPVIAGLLGLLGVISGAGIVSMMGSRQQSVIEKPAVEDTDTKYGFEFRLGEPGMEGSLNERQ